MSAQAIKAQAGDETEERFLGETTRYWQLCFAMLRVGVVGYGGGPATIPLFRYEAVTRYQWLDDTEFAETLALASALPGPMATKLAAYIGYRRRGSWGATLALVANIAPSVLAMIVLAGVFGRLSKYQVIDDMIGAVVPVVAVMLGTMAYQFGKNAQKRLGWVLAAVAIVVAWVLLSPAHLSPGVVVLLFLAYGALHPTLQKRRRPGGGNGPDDLGSSRTVATGTPIQNQKGES